jgi:hypothetical protein
MLHLAENDPELGAWLSYQADNGSGFVRAFVNAAQLADHGQYHLLQPAIRFLRARYPEPDTSIRTLTRDDYKVVFNEQDETGSLDATFTRFNALIFGNELPQMKIRYATSIHSLREPGLPIGLLATPNDPVEHPMFGQYVLDVPHIFISEKLRRVAPVDEWVLLHEMCHYKVPNHRPDFVAEVKRALEAINWQVLLGGY